MVHELVLDDHRGDARRLGRERRASERRPEARADAVAVVEDGAALGPLGARRVRVDADRVDAALEEGVEGAGEARLAEDTAAEVVPGECREVPEVEEERLPQRDRLLEPRLVGDHAEEPIRPSPRGLEPLEAHRTRLSRAEANRSSGSVIHFSRARPLPASRGSRDSRVYLHESSVRISSPAGERELDAGGGHTGRDAAPRPQAHLDPLAARLVEGAVLEVGDVEVGAEPRVQDPEDVEVELGGHPRRVVVGRVEPCLVLDEVDAHEEAVAGREDRCGGAEERRQLTGVQVPDRPREEQHQSAAARPERPEVVDEVARDTRDRRLGVVGLETRHGVAQVRLVDLEQRDAFEPCALAHGVQEEPDLVPCARAQLGELAGLDRLDDGAGVRGEEGRLGARLVVLGQLGDRLEERAAALVVEVLARQFGERTAREARAHLFDHRRQGVLHPGRATDGVGQSGSGRSLRHGQR